VVAPKLWNFGSTSRLFENDTSTLSLGTDMKVGEPTKTNNGEISLHFWAFFYFKIALHALIFFWIVSTDASPTNSHYLIALFNCERLICYKLQGLKRLQQQNQSAGTPYLSHQPKIELM
jgi:hypothetical protein